MRLVVESPDARKELLSEVVELSAKQELPSRRMFEAIASVAKQGGDLQYSALEGRLKSEDRVLFDKLLLAGEGPEPSLDAGRSAVDALRREARKREYQVVLHEIGQAEKSGDNEKLLDLLRRKKEMAAPIVDRQAGGRRIFYESPIPPEGAPGESDVDGLARTDGREQRVIQRRPRNAHRNRALRACRPSEQ